MPTRLTGIKRPRIPARIRRAPARLGAGATLISVAECEAECIDIDMKQRTLVVSAGQNAQDERYRKATSRDVCLAPRLLAVP
jgi:hypothetical protein